MAKAKSKSARPAAAPKGRTTAKGPAKASARNIGGADEGVARPSAKDAAAKAVAKPAAEPKRVREKLDTETAERNAPAPDAGARAKPAATKRTTPSPSSRYTPPIPKSEKISPIWVPIMMFTCLGLGMSIIILNYVNVLPGANPSNVYLMIGLGLITVGFITATKYH